MGDLISLAHHRDERRPSRERAAQQQQRGPSLGGEGQRLGPRPSLGGEGQRLGPRPSLGGEGRRPLPGPSLGAEGAGPQRHPPGSAELPQQGRPSPPEGPPPVTFYFDLASPFTYLAAERVDRLLGGARWSAASGEALRRHDPWREAIARDAAERRAAQLRMPLVWPERPAEGARGAMRAAKHAADLGRGAAFVIAASRLAFCGGFDLDDPDVLSEAAAAAGVSLSDCLRAARDQRIDAALETTAHGLLAAGVDRLPAVQVGQTIFAGEQRLAEAAAFARIAPPDRRTRARSTAR